MEIAVGLRRKTRMDTPIVLVRLEIIFNDLMNEILRVDDSWVVSDSSSFSVILVFRLPMLFFGCFVFADNGEDVVQSRPAANARHRKPERMNQVCVLHFSVSATR